MSNCAVKLGYILMAEADISLPQPLQGMGNVSRSKNLMARKMRLPAHSDETYDFVRINIIKCSTYFSLNISFRHSQPITVSTEDQTDTNCGGNQVQNDHQQQYGVPRKCTGFF